MKKGFIKGEALRLLRTNSSQITFERNIRNFHNRLLERGYPAAILRKYLSEVKIANRKRALQQRNKSAGRKLLPFVTQYHLALPNLKRTLMGKWHLIQNQQRLREIFKEPPVISYRKGKSLKDLLVRAKLWRSYYFQYDLVQESCDARRLFLTISFLDLYLDKHHIRCSRTTLKRDKVDIVAAHIARSLVIGEIC